MSVFLNHVVPKLIDSFNLSSESLKYDLIDSRDLALDILTHVTKFQGSKMCKYIIQNSIIQRLEHLFTHSSKHLRLGILRFFRAFIGNKEESVIKYIVKYDLFSTIFVLMQNYQRDNMVLSACLDIFQFVLKNDIKRIIKYLMKKHKNSFINGSLSKNSVMKAIRLNYENQSTKITEGDLLKNSESLSPENGLIKKRILPEKNGKHEQTNGCTQ